MLEAYFRSQSLAELESGFPRNAADAERDLARILDEEPDNVRALYLRARSYAERERLPEARQSLEALLRLHPAHVPAKVELARILASDNERAAAIKLLAEAAAEQPETTVAWQLLARWFAEEGRTDESRNALKQYEMIKAFNDGLNAAEQAYAQGDFRAADAMSRQLLQLVPGEVRTLRLLARIGRQFQHYEFSTSTLAQCVEQRPQDATLALEYAYSLLAGRMYPQALVQTRRAIALGPENIDAYDLLAETLFNLGRYAEAIDIYRELSSLPIRRASRLCHLGKVLKTVGDAEGARACYREALAIEPGLGQAYWELADLKTYRFTGNEIEAMQRQLESAELKVMDRLLIDFALGKALEDTRDFAASFRHYEAANGAYVRIRPYHHVDQVERFGSVFTATYFAERKELGQLSNAPIFVVGVPRSGTTLVEQILSSHSQVDATRELDEIISIARAVNNPGAPADQQYPQSMALLSPERIEELALRYLDSAQSYRQQAPHFIDKSPRNFHHIGLIKTLFPRAKIIDVRRHPLASGWSQYRQFFAESFLFSYDLEAIGKYYAEYVRLMEHWHAVLPGQVLTVRYEELVTDPRVMTESLLAYCGLEFEEGCLDFHLNKRAVATPSSEQVRQPLYTKALEHWKHYDEFLGPLKQTLREEGIDLPGE